MMRFLTLATIIAVTTPLAAQTSQPATGPPAASSPGIAVPVEPVAKAGVTAAVPVAVDSAADPAAASRFAEADVLGAAEDVFGKGAEGIGEAIRRTVAARGQPNAYIVGREAGGAFIVGVRYGSGTLHHKVEGEQPVHWAGPSVGVDVGGDGSKVFALVYNLDDTADLFHRFAGGGGKAYFVGGVAVDFLTHGRVIVVPIKLGVGLRLGLNGGYTKYSKKADFNPF